MGLSSTPPIFVTANLFSRYLAPLGAKYLKKGRKKIAKKTMFFLPFLGIFFWAVKGKLSSRDQVGCQRSLPDGLGVAWERPEAVARQPRGRRPGAPMQLPSHRGGCASSRLDHGLINPENPNVIYGKLVETTQKPSKKS